MPEKARGSNQKNDDMNGGKIGGRLNSDNSFSDQGLNNLKATKDAMDNQRRKF